MPKLVEYIKQRNKYSCGPVAIMNTLIYLGKDIDYERDYKKYMRLCRCDKEGSDKDGVTRALRKKLPKEYSFFKGKIRHIHHLDHLVGLLNSHGLYVNIIIGFRYKEIKHITVIIPSHDRRYYNTINNNNRTFIKLPRRLFRKSIKKKSLPFWLIVRKPYIHRY